MAQTVHLTQIFIIFFTMKWLQRSDSNLPIKPDDAEIATIISFPIMKLDSKAAFLSSPERILLSVAYPTERDCGLPKAAATAHDTPPTSGRK